ncbi:hypothetical protein [Streptomyces albiflavescens]|nr:hypothetical protein [Streptomyces albiflavescens]
MRRVGGSLALLRLRTRLRAAAVDRDCIRRLPSPPAAAALRRCGAAALRRCGAAALRRCGGPPGVALEGHESARQRGKTTGGAGVADPDMLSMALHLREQEMSLRDIAAKPVITTGKEKGQHPSPATVVRMLRDHDEQNAQAVVNT